MIVIRMNVKYVTSCARDRSGDPFDDRTIAPFAHIGYTLDQSIPLSFSASLCKTIETMAEAANSPFTVASTVACSSSRF